jgi:hypothetical protein
VAESRTAVPAIDKILSPFSGVPKFVPSEGSLADLNAWNQQQIAAQQPAAPAPTPSSTAEYDAAAQKVAAENAARAAQQQANDAKFQQDVAALGVGSPIKPGSHPVSVTVAPQAPMAPTQTPSPTPGPASPPPPAFSEQTTTTFTPGVHIPQAIKDQKSAALDAASAAQVEQNRVQAEEARQTSLVLQERNNALEKKNKDDLAEAQVIREEANGAHQKFLGLVDEYNKNKTTDPRGFYKKGGVGVGILAAIAQGLGQFGAAMTRSPNAAAQIIQDAINADIRSQEQEIQNKREGVQLQGNVVNYFRQKGLDQEQRARAGRIAITDAAIAKLDELAAKTKNESFLARAGEIKANLLAAKAQEAEKNFIQEQGRAVTQRTRAPAQGMSVDDQVKLNGLKVDVPQVDPKTGKETGYRTYMARSKEDAEKIRQAFVVRNEIKSNLGRMSQLVQDHWQSVPGTTGKKKVETVMNDLRTQFGVLRHLGALSDQDFVVASQLGDPTALSQPDFQTQALITDFNQRLDSMVDAEMKGRGMYR